MKPFLLGMSLLFAVCLFFSLDRVFLVLWGIFLCAGIIVGRIDELKERSGCDG